MRARKEGLIMIHLILALSILVSALMLLGRFMTQYQKSVEDSLSGIKRRLEHRSMIYQGIALIAQDELELDHLGESWNRMAHNDLFNRQGILLEIEDESGKLDLNQLMNEDPQIKERYEGFLSRLFEILRVPLSKRREIFEFVKFHGPLKSLYQLPAIQEVMNDHSIDLSRYLTVYSGGRVNVNTAPAEVLEVLLEGIDPFLLKEILEVRGKRPFQEAGRVGGISQDTLRFMTVKSSHFRIETRQNPEGKRKSDVIVQRSLGEIKIRQWIER